MKWCGGKLATAFGGVLDGVAPPYVRKGRGHLVRVLNLTKYRRNSGCFYWPLTHLGN